MRIGMYNRWLFTLGGGEKESMAIAAYLSRKHDVSVISHTPVSKEEAAERLNLDLSRLNFVTIPERLAPEITPITKEYDFFINVSYMDFFSSLAPISATLIFFPNPVELEQVTWFRRSIKYGLRRWMMLPAFASGVVSTQVIGQSQVRVTDAAFGILLPPSRSALPIHFDLSSRHGSVRQAEVVLNGKLVETVDLPADQAMVPFELVVPVSEQGRSSELTVRVPGEQPLAEKGRAKLALANFEIKHPRYHLYQVIFERWLKNYGMRMHYTSPGIFSILDSLETYDAIWAISEYTQKWIKRYWNRESSIINPTVDVDNYHPLPKCNRILTVGRFFLGSHNKKHSVLLKAFKEMVDSGLQGWELHIAGGRTPGLDHEQYLAKLYEDAQGYPNIFIHPDIPFDDLIRLYGESAIYWHASGFGEDEEREPVRFEHFGITTVEAMASGCVPVVIGKGGQPEIVQHGESGFLWDTTAQLKEYTLQLINDVELRERMAKAALRDCRRYSPEQFNARLQHLLEDIGVE